MMKTAALVMALLFGVSQSLDLAFTGNVSLSNQEHDFSYRSVSFGVVPLFVNTAIYSSLAIDHSGDDSSGSASVDIVAGMVNVPYDNPIPGLDVNIFPVSWVAYFSADVEYNIADIATASIDAAGSFAATVYSKLEEVNANGEVVHVHLLSEKLFGAGSKSTAGGGNLHYITFSHSSSFDIEMTFAVSAVIGKVTGDATITPKSMETFFEVKNYPYDNVANHLRLTVYTASLAGSAAKTFEATHTMISGSGEGQVYFQFSGEAICDGETKSVTINAIGEATVNSDEIDSDIVTGKISGHSDLTSDFRKVVIDFPAGAVEITYDPSMGFGAPDSSSFLAPSLSLLIISVFAIFALF